MAVDRYVYPAILRFHQGGVDVEFPDVPGCFSQGNDQDQVLDAAREALGLHMYGLEVDGDPIPPASLAPAIRAGVNEVVALVDVWMPPMRHRIADRAVKKTVTLPSWLNQEGERHGVNFSHLLQRALKEHLGIKE